jgi:hypothetical protein
MFGGNDIPINLNNIFLPEWLFVAIFFENGLAL